MRNQGLGSWPARRARSTPHRRALVLDDQALTYAEVYERVTRLAHALRELGVRRGDRVAFLGPNLPSFVETLFAVHTLGAIFVPLNTRLTVTEVQFQLTDCAATALVYAPQSAGVVEHLRTDELSVVAVSGGAGKAHDYESLIQAASTEPIDEPVEQDEPAFILYTSGTTGRPKGAVLTHANVTWNCVNVLIELDLTSDAVTLVSAPLFHVAALNMTLLPTFLKGACAVLTTVWNVDACFDIIERHKVTWMFGVPAMFAGVAQAPRWETADLSSLRFLMSGGAPVPTSLIHTYQERGLLFLQGFGVTEAAPGALMLSAEMSVDKAGSAGVPHFFTDVRVARRDLSEAGSGEPGEVLIQGPTVMPGYWHRPDATEEAFSEGGWLHTGDVGKTDEDGYIYIIDRIKDMYISGGENVYPAEVESALLEHPAILDCAVIGTPNDTWGEVGLAYVTARPEAGLDEQQVIAFLDGRLARYKIPKSVRFVDDLPRTGSGKVQKAELRSRDTKAH